VRIISGTYRGKIIHPPSGFSARPTTDFAKESLFNILQNHFDIENAAVLDLFAGTGSISYEFASRGAARITTIEADPVHFRFIKRTAEQMDLQQMQVIRSDAFAFIRKPFESYDIIFADPPYDHPDLAKLPDHIFDTNILLPEGWFILEHGAKERFEAHPHFRQRRKYGSVNFSVFT
jgi:16S rRNA (guanine(966)-N(2))-methyltransferase RsmD